MIFDTQQMVVSSGDATFGDCNRFTVKLSMPLKLKGKWEMTLKDILFPVPDPMKYDDEPDDAWGRLRHSIFVLTSAAPVQNVGRAAVRLLTRVPPVVNQIANTDHITPPGPGEAPMKTMIYYNEKSTVNGWIPVDDAIVEQVEFQVQLSTGEPLVVDQAKASSVFTSATILFRQVGD